MKLVWHIFLKDLRRIRVALAAWVALLIAKVVMGFSVFAPAAADAAWFERMQLAHGVAVGIEVVICFMLAASLVLDDSLVGSTMFWATRPIDGRRLLAAKLLGALLLFFVVPLLIAMPWWLACGAGIPELRASISLLFTIQAFTVFPAMVLASVVERSGRFVQVLLIVLVAFVLLSMMKVARSQPHDLPVPVTLSETRFWLTMCGALAAVAGTIWVQFATRRTRRSVAYLSAVLALTWWTSVAWPWDVARQWRQTKIREDFAAAMKVRADLRGVRLSDAPYRPNTVKLVKFEFEVDELPTSYPLSLLRADVTLRWAAGDEHRQTARGIQPAPMHVSPETLGLKLPTWANDAETRAHLQQIVGKRKEIRRSLGERWEASQDAKKAPLAAEMIVPADLARRIEETPPAFDIVLELVFKRAEVLAEIPLELGKTTVGKGIRFEVVADKAKDGDDARAGARELVFVSAGPLLDSAAAFSVVQRETGFFSYLSSATYDGAVLPRRAGFSRAALHLVLPRVWRGDKWEPIPDNDAPFSIVAVVFRHAGIATREFHGERLPVAAAAAK